MLEQVQLEVDRNAIYEFGAKLTLVIGAPGDCSSKLAAIFIRAGIPVRRSQAARMFLGLDGWTHEETFPFKDAPACSIVVMTMQKKRPRGHVGLYREKTAFDISNEMAHAGRHGFVAVIVWADPRDPYFPNIDGIFSIKGVE